MPTREMIGFVVMMLAVAAAGEVSAAPPLKPHVIFMLGDVGLDSVHRLLAHCHELETVASVARAHIHDRLCSVRLS